MKKYLLCYSEGHKEFHAKVENLNPTEDGKASEESHGAADKAKLACQSDLSVSLYLIVGCCVKEDLDQLQGGEFYGLNCNKKTGIIKY